MDNPYYEKLVNAALRFVSFRPRSERELIDFLTKKLAKWKVVGEELIKKVVERMRDLGYVDDHAFVSWWLTQRSTFRPKGKRALVGELMKKGIPKDIIERETFDEYESAKRAIQKKIVVWAKLPIIEQKKKLYTFLAQRGFSSETISRIIDGLGKKAYN